jgi:hypothetical protein
MKLARRHYMVKIVLIGKSRGVHCLHQCNRAWFVALAFIFNELRGVMVNPALPRRARVNPPFGASGHMNPILNHAP